VESVAESVVLRRVTEEVRLGIGLEEVDLKEETQDQEKNDDHSAMQPRARTKFGRAPARLRDLSPVSLWAVLSVHSLSATIPTSWYRNTPRGRSPQLGLNLSLGGMIETLGLVEKGAEVKQFATAFLALSFTVPVLAQEVVEPRSGVRFPVKIGDMSLLGVGLRTKTLFKVKVYAIGLYVAEGAWAGPLAPYKGKLGTPTFYKDLVSGDFGKQIVLKFVRDVTTSQIQGAFRESLESADKARVDAFVSDFADTKSGEEYDLHWVPGGSLEVTVAGQPKPVISDRAFAAAVFAIWLGDKPVQDDVKKDLVARASATAH
jgi:hypothetical protein